MSRYIDTDEEVMKQLDKVEETERPTVWHLMKDALPALRVPFSVE